MNSVTVTVIIISRCLLGSTCVPSSVRQHWLPAGTASERPPQWHHTPGQAHSRARPVWTLCATVWQAGWLAWTPVPHSVSMAASAGHKETVQPTAGGRLPTMHPSVLWHRAPGKPRLRWAVCTVESRCDAMEVLCRAELFQLFQRPCFI